MAVEDLLKESEILKTINKTLSYQISLNQKRINEIENIVAAMTKFDDEELHGSNSKWICDACDKVKDCNLYKSQNKHTPIQICEYYNNLSNNVTEV